MLAPLIAAGLVFFGDSVARNQAAFMHELSYARGGAVAAEVPAQWDRFMRAPEWVRAKFSLAVVIIGYNDTLGGWGASVWPALAQTVAAMRASGLHVLWVREPLTEQPPGEVHVLDARELPTRDGIHLTPLGLYRLAVTVDVWRR